VPSRRSPSTARALFSKRPSTGAITLYRAASLAFEKLEMRGHVMIADRRRGEILGGREGQSLVAASDAWLDAQRVRDKERMAQLIAPHPKARPLR
jgi:hypothetical protein